jgi:hypothetical protein
MPGPATVTVGSGSPCVAGSGDQLEDRTAEEGKEVTGGEVSGIRRVPSTSDMSDVVKESDDNDYDHDQPHDSAGATPGLEEAPLPISPPVEVQIIRVVERTPSPSESEIERQCSQGWTKSDVVCNDEGAAEAWEVEAEDSDGEPLVTHGWICQTLLKPPLRFAAKSSTSRAVSPVPEGYELNVGRSYIPFNILNEYGQETPAKYVEVHPEADPWARGRMSSAGAVYSGPVHVAPKRDRQYDIVYDEDYEKEQLRFFLPSYERALQVEHTLHLIPDRALGLEVQRYRHYSQRIQELEDRIAKMEDEMYDYILGRHECVVRLGKADAVRRIRSRMPQDIRRTAPYIAEPGRSA